MLGRTDQSFRPPGRRDMKTPRSDIRYLADSLDPLNNLLLSNSTQHKTRHLKKNQRGWRKIVFVDLITKGVLIMCMPKMSRGITKRCAPWCVHNEPRHPSGTHKMPWWGRIFCPQRESRAMEYKPPLYSSCAFLQRKFQQNKIITPGNFQRVYPSWFWNETERKKLTKTRRK